MHSLIPSFIMDVYNHMSVFYFYFKGFCVFCYHNIYVSQKLLPFGA